MTQYSKEMKENIIRRMLPPNNISVPVLSSEMGIPRETLYTWRIKAQKGETPVPTKISNELSSEDKFNIVLETASLNEIELGEYCRRKGLFVQQISTWRETCTQAHAPLKSRADKMTLRSQKKEIKSLKVEIRRKEKALAEAAALLILQKKVRALWLEEPEGEKSTMRRGSR